MRDPKTEQPEKSNRLIHEKSVYLQQHAHNPVDWYPWGEEAFEKAKKEDRPIFLSIGYSTCHWCHVMERESFEDDEIAAYLNEHFVAIKVDREERPDVDAVYMSYVVARTGSGGWPLSVFLTPDRLPFFGGTYFPPRDRPGRPPGFHRVLTSIHDLWKAESDRVREGMDGVVEYLEARTSVPQQPGEPGHQSLDSAYKDYESRFDDAYGGTAGAPKFPAPMALGLLLRHELRTGDPRALEMVDRTLNAMADGGMHDHLGGGFARYSTDEEWLVPHFEKMLYDNAQLARIYAEAYQRTDNERYEKIARGILDYLLRDMRVEGGAFAAAEDADSEGEEGLFYTWTPDEVVEVLGKDLGGKASKLFGVLKYGQVEGRSVLYLADADAVSPSEWDDITSQLFLAREKRIRPLRDDKVLAGWNGLAISAFSFCGRVFDEPRYIVAAEEAADFILTRMVTDEGLKRRYREGEAAIAGHLSDHAYLAQGLLDLYEADFDTRWLIAAEDLTARIIVLFGDEETGTFFDTIDLGEELPIRPRDASDRAVPSATAVAVKTLLRISDLKMDDEMRERATRCLAAYMKAIEQTPLAYVEFLNTLSYFLEPPREVVFSGEKGREDLENLIRAFYSEFRPFRVLAHASADPERLALDVQALPLLEGKPQVDGKAAAYVCERYACKAPVTDPLSLGKEK